MSGICYIAGASGEDFDDLEIKEGDMLIASDGGYEALIKKGYSPDVLIGDFDSMEYIEAPCETIRYPSVKDDTDTMLCIKYGMEKGYKNFTVVGALGGDRISHTYANIQSLAYAVENGCSCRLVSKKQEVFMIKNGIITFEENMKGYVSVFAYSENAYGVCETGLKYEIENATLSNSFPLGVSNAFTGKLSSISVKEGIILVIVEKINK